MRLVINTTCNYPVANSCTTGMFFIVPCLEEFKKIDLRTLSFDVPPQEVLTKDSVTVSVDAVVYWRVDKPLTSVVRVANAYYSTLLLAQTTLRNILGTKELREVLSQREEIVGSMQVIFTVYVFI